MRQLEPDVVVGVSVAMRHSRVPSVPDRMARTRPGSDVRLQTQNRKEMELQQAGGPSPFSSRKGDAGRCVAGAARQALRPYPSHEWTYVDTFELRKQARVAKYKH